ncbi:hypothetical protein Baya_7989 [Bagarius yarrelli]|uniref:Uncharacterized protein n=1 Tax=Bagarius yarrelli TaxID=175774 RepID=A0A556U2W7_BAGYA|nr:hypothetical protein Baya_7989 [Bagarius yarrelli]
MEQQLMWKWRLPEGKGRGLAFPAITGGERCRDNETHTHKRANSQTQTRCRTAAITRGLSARHMPDMLRDTKISVTRFPQLGFKSTQAVCFMATVHQDIFTRRGSQGDMGSSDSLAGPPQSSAGQRIILLLHHLKTNYQGDKEDTVSDER